MLAFILVTYFAHNAPGMAYYKGCFEEQYQRHVQMQKCAIRFQNPGEEEQYQRCQAQAHRLAIKEATEACAQSEE